MKDLLWGFFVRNGSFFQRMLEVFVWQLGINLRKVFDLSSSFSHMSLVALQIHPSFISEPFLYSRSFMLLYYTSICFEESSLGMEVRQLGMNLWKIFDLKWNQSFCLFSSHIFLWLNSRFIPVLNLNFLCILGLHQSEVLGQIILTSFSSLIYPSIIQEHSHLQLSLYPCP